VLAVPNAQPQDASSLGLGGGTVTFGDGDSTITPTLQLGDDASITPTLQLGEEGNIGGVPMMSFGP
jgi:hypothetical protein